MTGLELSFCQSNKSKVELILSGNSDAKIMLKTHKAFIISDLVVDEIAYFKNKKFIVFLELDFIYK